MGYYKEKEEYEQKKRDEEFTRAVLMTILKVVGVIVSFIFLKLLAPIASKHPIATLIVVLTLGIGGYIYFTSVKPSDEQTVESFEDFANSFFRNEDYCKQHISKIVAAEGYSKKSFKRADLSAKKIMSSFIGSDSQNYTGDGLKNELCYGQFSKVSDYLYTYQLRRSSDNSLVKLYEFTNNKREWLLTKIQKGGEITEKMQTGIEDYSTNVQRASDNNETNFIRIEDFSIYVPVGFVKHRDNTYVLFDNEGVAAIYFCYEVLSTPKEPWDLNPDASEADYSSSAEELYVSREGGNEMSSVWRQYKKGNKWCLLTALYNNDSNDIRSYIYDFMAKSN